LAVAAGVNVVVVGKGFVEFVVGASLAAEEEVRGFL
jgi:hypothetical protein